MVTVRAPVEKLSLAVRKNVRDTWEAKRPEIESKISDMLGQPWTALVDANLLFAYAENSAAKERLGSVIMWYMEPLFSNLGMFLSKFGDNGRWELNTVCWAHQIVIAPDESGKVLDCGCDVKDGVLRLTFNEHHLGGNASYASQDITGALKNAPPPPSGTGSINFIARHSVSANYEPKIEKLRSAIGELLGVPSISLNPNFQHNYAQLKKLGDHAPSLWDEKLGGTTFDYFEGVRRALEQQGFKGDDMLQEGFQEAVDKGEICLRIVDKLNKGLCNEVVVEGGVLYVQTVPGQWASDVNGPAQELLHLL